MITYPVSAEVTSWALTLPEQSGAEADWGLITAEEMDQRKRKLLDPIAPWKSQAPRELVQSAQRMIKFGLFDRDEMRPELWHTRRCALAGDAGHPTSPHLGQGANQALYDLLSDDAEHTANDPTGKTVIISATQSRIGRWLRTTAQSFSTT
jgi:salicylate hydroxylase